MLHSVLHVICCTVSQCYTMLHGIRNRELLVTFTEMEKMITFDFSS